MKWLKAALALMAVTLISLYLVLKLLLTLLVEGFWFLVAAVVIALAVHLWRRHHQGRSHGKHSEAAPRAAVADPGTEPEPRQQADAERELHSRSHLALLGHKDRSYVVVGRDHGFTAGRSDAYLRLGDIAPTRRSSAEGDHSALVARYSARRRAERTRSTRP